MEPKRRTRQFLLPALLTAACTAGAVGLGMWPFSARTAAAQPFPIVGESCSNTECQGTVHCRYMSRISCAFELQDRCVNTSC